VNTNNTHVHVQGPSTATCMVLITYYKILKRRKTGSFLENSKDEKHFHIYISKLKRHKYSSYSSSVAQQVHVQLHLPEIL